MGIVNSDFEIRNSETRLAEVRGRKVVNLFEGGKVRRLESVAGGGLLVAGCWWRVTPHFRSAIYHLPGKGVG